VSWTERDATLTVDAIFVFAADFVVFGVVAVGVVGALVNADFASDAFVFVAFYDVFWR
jgi:hypothetical protein